MMGLKQRDELRVGVLGRPFDHYEILHGFVSPCCTEQHFIVETLASRL